MRVHSLVVCLFVIATAGLLQAQSTGTILGTVTDNSGAVVAKASVNITNAATGSVRVRSVDFFCAPGAVAAVHPSFP